MGNPASGGLYREMLMSPQYRSAHEVCHLGHELWLSSFKLGPIDSCK